eukprot:5992206-Pleurochrysis_carterae.AAC.1
MRCLEVSKGRETGKALERDTGRRERGARGREGGLKTAFNARFGSVVMTLQTCHVLFGCVHTAATLLNFHVT